MPAARALAQLAAGRADGTYERRLASFARPHLLILDDFGLKPLRAPAPEDLYEIVAERYEKGSVIITSNRAFAEWPEVVCPGDEATDRDPETPAASLRDGLGAGATCHAAPSFPLAPSVRSCGGTRAGRGPLRR